MAFERYTVHAGRGPIVRVVVATHRELSAMVREQLFREDLLARLQGYVMELPSLEQRREDLGHLIADLLLRTFGDRSEQVHFDRLAARALMLCGWPLNVRELWRVLRRAVMLADGQNVQLHHLPLELLHESPGTRDVRALSERDQERRDQLVEALRQNAGNVSAAARSMNTMRTQVQRWMRRYEIEADEYLPSATDRGSDVRELDLT